MSTFERVRLACDGCLTPFYTAHLWFRNFYHSRPVFHIVILHVELFEYPRVVVRANDFLGATRERGHDLMS